MVSVEREAEQIAIAATADRSSDDVTELDGMADSGVSTTEKKRSRLFADTDEIIVCHGRGGREQVLQAGCWD